MIEAFWTELFAGFYRELCLKQDIPRGKKKHNIPCLFLLGLTTPAGHAQPELQEGSELCLQQPQCWTQHTRPSSSRMQLSIATYWRQLLIAARTGLKTPSTWNKRFFQCFVVLGLWLASPSLPFRTGNSSCSLRTEVFWLQSRVQACRSCVGSSPHLLCSALQVLVAVPGSVSAAAWDFLLVGLALSSCSLLCPTQQTPGLENYDFYIHFLQLTAIWFFQIFPILFSGRKFLFLKKYQRWFSKFYSSL